MTVVTTIDVYAMPPEEYRAILDHMGVETRPAAGLFLHLTSKTDFGFRVIEIWDRKEGFDEFGPRLQDLPGLIASLPGARRRSA